MVNVFIDAIYLMDVSKWKMKILWSRALSTKTNQPIILNQTRNRKSIEERIGFLLFKQYYSHIKFLNLNDPSISTFAINQE